jgi:hypothetical protein
MSAADLQKPLPIDQIDFRIQSINKGRYATILAYKDARVDMNRLNSVYGIGFWQRKHDYINGKEFCSVGIWNKEISQWCWVQDCGTQSNTEKEKGQSSDAFKRACFNLGIGIELYDYPEISVQLNTDEVDMSGPKPKAVWSFKLKYWSWYSEFSEDGRISFLAGKDQSGVVRFKWGEMKPKEVINDKP